jgi:hypothetical protein
VAPSDQHKEGIRLLASFGGVAHECVSTSLTLWDAIDALDDLYLAGVTQHRDMLPIVGISEVRTQIVKNNAQLFIPTFAILDWTPRPPELPATGIPLFRREKKGDASNDSFGYTRPQPDMDDSLPF